MNVCVYILCICINKINNTLSASGDADEEVYRLSRVTVGLCEKNEWKKKKVRLNFFIFIFLNGFVLYTYYYYIDRYTYNTCWRCYKRKNKCNTVLIKR